MRAVGERVWPGLAAVVISFCALFFSQGLSDAPLVWIGGAALVAAAVCVAWGGAPGASAAAYLGCLWGLAIWCGLSMLWSASPDGSWSFTNRTIVYAGFATLGVFVGPQLERAAGAAALLVALVIGWALLAKSVPALYSDYGRVARLRAPLDDWNMLALVCVAGVPLALWLAGRSRVAGTVLLYFAALTLLLTYSRFGVALACLAAAAWVMLQPDRVESIGELALAAVAATGAFAVALSLSGITSDGEPRHVRSHDGWIFALALLGGAALVGAVTLLARRLPPVAPGHRRAVERAAAALALAVALAGLGVTIAKANTIWHEFTNPVAAQTTNATGHLTQLGSGNRWTWWQEAWDGFTGRPLGGTGAGTFRFTDLRLRQSTDITALEPHNMPLQFLSETGIVGFLLFAGAAAVALRAAFRRRSPAGTALAIVLAAFFAHTIVNYDWSFLGVSGPLLLLGGIASSRPAGAAIAGARQRWLPIAAAVVFAAACVYSLAAPWLADRAQASAATALGAQRYDAAAADLKRAHAYDPLATGILVDQAALASDRDAVRLYRDALALEPSNASLWFQYALFYAQGKHWHEAYQALARAYRFDPFGPAGQCGAAETIRRQAGVKGVTCRGGGSASLP